MVKNNKNIKIITIKQKQHKLSQFVEDTSFIFEGSNNSFTEALNTLEKYANISGLNVNKYKTQVIRIGSKKLSSDVYHHR